MYKALATLIIAAAPFVAAADTQLMMAEEPGCMWCARWNAEVGDAYHKTHEGDAAPLRRVDITDPIPDDIILARSVNFTPTFVLLVDGAEVGRLEGYAGEDFFWGLLGVLLNENGIEFEQPIPVSDGQ
ncbi:hypothetical protein L0666_03990 [Octadecabacter sp. CECT 8868]|uniref:hypothetical protein n=1 Tax=Octadecabacter algicola TaxID=2909342 RepID=UPI001F3FB5B0|nr:hypothetical protein [Octadecabacter algicola]MCF2904139.1 hypothetical protein [Octadecabacter algicola]